MAGGEDDRLPLARILCKENVVCSLVKGRDSSCKNCNVDRPGHQLWFCTAMEPQEILARRDNVYDVATGIYDVLSIDTFQDRLANRNDAQACDVPKSDLI